MFTLCIFDGVGQPYLVNYANFSMALIMMARAKRIGCKVSLRHWPSEHEGWESRRAA